MTQTRIQRRGLMLVLSSPSGAGKTTISRHLLPGDDEIDLSISVTTRPKRANEIEGVDYHFVDQPTFDQLVIAGELLAISSMTYPPKESRCQLATEGRFDFLA